MSASPGAARRGARPGVLLADAVATWVIRLIAFFLVALLAAMVVHLMLAGYQELNLTFLTTRPKTFEAGGGVGPQLFNSFYVLALSLVFTIPIGMAAGIYMAEYARPGVVLSALRTATETLATLPSIVVGLFGLLVFVELTGWHYTRLGGALALTVINLPYAVRVTEDALRGVPDALREGSFGLGGTRWQTVRRVLLPAALPDLVTGLILISGRGFGEAAALLYTAGQDALTRNFYSLNPLAPGETLSVFLYAARAESNAPDISKISDGTAALLVLVVLIFNLVARTLGRVVVRRIQGL